MKRRICFYAVATELGGAERSLLELLKGLMATDSCWDPSVLLPKKDGPLIEELKKLAVEYHVEEFPVAFLKMSRKNKGNFFSLFFALPSMISYLIKVRSWIIHQKVALIHTTGIKCHILGVLIGRLGGIPVLLHMRDILQPGLSEKILKFIFRRSGVFFVANSGATAAPFTGMNKTPSIVYNGISPQDFHPDRKKIYSSHFQVGSDVPIVGIVGAFTEWKGQKEFLKAAKILFDRGIRARFVVVGARIYDTDAEADYGRELIEAVKSFGIEKQVLFPGFEKNSALAMNSIDILVHASTKPEPFGRVIIEAMACKTSVIASKWGAAPEIFTNLNQGLIVDPKNPSEIADAVQWLIENPEEASRMKDSAHELFLGKFTHEHYLKEMKEQFSKITQEVTTG